MLFWPLNLSGLYAPKIMTGINVTLVFSATVLLMIGVGGFLLLKRRKDLFFWFAFFFLGLLPVAQIIPLVSLINDRYLYFPMIGVATLAALCGVTAADNWSGTLRKIGLAGTVLVIGAFSVISWQRTQVWQNQDTFWTDVYQKSPPGSFKFWMHLASSQFQAGETSSALLNYKRAIDCDPENADGWLALARAEEKAGNLEAAAQAYHNVTILAPEDYQGWQGLREIEQSLGKKPKP